MSYKLVFGLSLFGVAMAFATVFVIAPTAEPLYWAAILVVCAAAIAKRAPGRYFLHGLAVGVVNGVWITAAHVALFDRYLAGHAREAALAAELGPPKLAMLATGPVVGLASGIVLGLVAFVASKFIVSAHSDFAGW